MGFANKFVSAEDVDSYKLNNLFNRFILNDYYKLPRKEFVHSWTVDEERNSYLVLIKDLEEIGPSGRLEPNRKSLFVLSVNGKSIKVILEKF